MEGAARGIPSLAISLETKLEHHLSYSEEVDFSAAAYFAAYFGELLMKRQLPPDVKVLKIDLPMEVTPDTPWELTYLSPVRMFDVVPPKRESWDQPAKVGYRFSEVWPNAPEGSDIHTVRIKRLVSVTPLSLDLTSRADFGEIRAALGSNESDR
jgi:5'-nucleotidase